MVTSLNDALEIADAAGVKDATVVCATRPPDLQPCPFCGEGGEYHEHASRLSPTMRGPGAIVSVALRHWCTRLPGCVSSYHEVRGRDREAAVAQWNQRVALPYAWGWDIGTKAPSTAP